MTPLLQSPLLMSTISLSCPSLTDGQRAVHLARHAPRGGDGAVARLGVVRVVEDRDLPAPEPASAVLDLEVVVAEPALDVQEPTDPRKEPRHLSAAAAGRGQQDQCSMMGKTNKS